jgi:hypothetical protein
MQGQERTMPAKGVTPGVSILRPWSKSMDKSAFEAADPLVDGISEIVDTLLDSEQTAPLRQALNRLGEALGDRYSIALDVSVQVFDRDREQVLPMLTTGLSTSAGQEPYRTRGDSSPQRYIVDGQIQIVPHDRCPNCWEVWDFKFDNRSCPHCGTTLGEHCKVLLDADVCPYCENGKVSLSKPTCDQCGYKVDLNVVTWG